MESILIIIISLFRKSYPQMNMVCIDVLYFIERYQKANTIQNKFYTTSCCLSYHWRVCFIGIVNRILSWNALLPLSRLSYCVYLVHYVLQDIQSLRTRSAVTTDIFSVVSVSLKWVESLNDCVFILLNTSVNNSKIQRENLDNNQLYCRNT